MPVDWRCNGCKRGFLARKRFGCPVVDLRFDAAQVIRSEFPRVLGFRTRLPGPETIELKRA